MPPFVLAAAITAETLLRTTLLSTDPMLGPDPSAPAAAPGLWMASAPDCAGAEGPLAPDLRGWPECARPIRIERESVGLVSPAPDGVGPPVRRLSTRYVLAPAWPGAPAVVQLDVPGLLDITYAYAAVEPGARDAQGRFTAARLWPVQCPAVAFAGVSAERSGCQASTPTAVHEAARLARPGPVLILRWIGP